MPEVARICRQCKKIWHIQHVDYEYKGDGIIKVTIINQCPIGYGCNIREAKI